MALANLRALAESHLSVTLEGAWAIEVDLIGPDGKKQLGLKAQVLYDRTEQNPATGQPVIVNEPVVVLRYSSLNPAPASPNEKWHISMPVSPVASAEKADFVLDPSRAIEGGRSIGIIRLYPKRVRQK
jgi:hypothetical protein